MSVLENISSQSVLPVQLSTGDPATVNDVVNPTSTSGQPYQPLGTSFYTTDAQGRIRKYRYVKLVGTAKPALIVGPVYWADDTKTTVTPTLSESKTGTVNSIAGVLLNAAATYGNAVCILVVGKATAVPVPALTAAGDTLIGAAGNQQFARVAAGTRAGSFEAAVALSAVAAGASDIDVCVDMY